MPPQNAANDAAANNAAQRIEDTYRTHGAAAAAQALRQDYEKSVDSTSQAVLAAERARIQQDNPNILPHLALEWAKPQTNGDNLSQKDLTMYATMGSNANPNTAGGMDARFAGDMAQQLSSNFGDLTKANWFTNAITDSDVSRAESNYDKTREGSSIANALLAKDSTGTTLFQKIAGTNPNGLTADNGQQTLQAALDRDKAHPFMTPDQRQAVQDLHDNWRSSAITPLSQGDAGQQMTEDSLNAFAKTNHLQPADASAAPPPAAAAAAATTDTTTGKAVDANAPQPEHVVKGEGWWDLAAQAYGDEDANKSLSARRSALNQKGLSPDENRKILALMKELEGAGSGPDLTGTYHFTKGADGIIHYQADASAAS